MPYSQKVLDRFEGVLNAPKQFSVGRFDPKDPNVATGMAGAPACGDVMKLQLKLDEEERIIDVNWGKSEHNQNYPVSIQIIGFDRQGLVRDITSILAENKISMLDLKSHINHKDNSVNINITFKIKDNESLSKISHKLTQIEGVNKIKRT